MSVLTPWKPTADVFVSLEPATAVRALSLVQRSRSDRGADVLVDTSLRNP
jgi:hypothetical protein